MDENGIKAAALTRIRQQAKGGVLPVVTSEFSLNGTGIRADLAVLDGGSFYGVEIKSASDTLKRLPSQMEGYARYFDRTELIVAPKHLRGLRDIDVHGAEVWRQEVLTDWQQHASGLTRRISGMWLMHLLPESEERRINRAIEQQDDLDQSGIDDARRSAFITAFRRRYAATSTNFWKAVRGRRIIVDDLKLLSRFYAERVQMRQLEAERKRRWTDWAAKMESMHAHISPPNHLQC